MRLKTAGTLSILIIMILSSIAMEVLSLSGYYMLYRWGGLLFGLFVPGIAHIAFPFLWWKEVHVFPWGYIAVFIIATGAGIVFAINMQKDSNK